MIAEQIEKHIWLLETFINAGERGLLLEEIQRKWERRFGTEYTRRTFNNHRESFQEVFGAAIECDRRTNRYYLPAGEDVIDSSPTIKWLVNTFTVNSLLAMGKERLSGRISVQDIPSGHKHLITIMEAMKENRSMTITYGKYDGSAAETLHVHPYAVKEDSRRWYLVAWCEERQALRVYGLDRIREAKTGSDTFKMPAGFDVDELFQDSYGMYLPEGETAQLITFRTSAREARFMRDLPMHHSQTEIETDGEGRVTFAIRVVPNVNLIMEFCRLADRVEVLSPAGVRQKITEQLQAAAGNYGLDKIGNYASDSRKYEK